MIRQFSAAAIATLAAFAPAAAGEAPMQFILAQADSGPPDQQPDGPQTGDRIPFCGKVVELVQAGCVGIVGLHSTVELTAVTPKPQAGALIAGTGIYSNSPNMCMQGMHISSATYTAVTSCVGE